MKMSRRDALRLGMLGVSGLAAAGGIREVTWGGPLRRERAAAAAAAVGRLASVNQPAVVSRAAWGADESRRVQSPLFAPVRQIFVHHTVTANNDPDPAATLRGIYDLHLAEGFNDVGYNFLIDAGGTIYEGRWTRTFDAGEPPSERDLPGLGTVGAHVEGHNVGTAGVALMGTFTGTGPTQAAVNALVGLLAWMADSYGLDPLASTGGEPVIAGHRDANNTNCPGDVLYGQLPGIRQAVAAQIAASAASHGPTPPTCVQVVPGGVTNSGKPVVTGQVTRSATHVEVSFTGAGLLGSRTLQVPASRGAFTVTPAAYGVQLGQGSLAVQAVAMDATGHPSAPTFVSTAYRVISDPLPGGYWILGRDGGIFAYGSAAFAGSMGGHRLNQPIVGMAATPAGDGYWLVASDGGIFAFGAAAFYGSTGSIRLNQPIVGMTTSPSGRGYRLVASDGGIFSFGDAPFFGSTGSIRLNRPIVGMAATPAGGGYWLVASDGGIFAFGDAAFHGSMAGTPLHRPIVGMEPTPSGKGYWLVGGDGGVFAFGDAPDLGSVPGLGVTDLGIRKMVATATGKGYYLLNTSGEVIPFGDAPHYGSPLTSGLEVSVIGMTLRA